MENLAVHGCAGRRTPPAGLRGGTAALRAGNGESAIASAIPGRGGVPHGDPRFPADRFPAHGAPGEGAAAPRFAGALRLQRETGGEFPAGGGEKARRRGERLAPRLRGDPERLPGQVPAGSEPEGVRTAARRGRTARRGGREADLLRLESARAESGQSARVRRGAADRPAGPLHLLHRLHRRLLSGDRRQAGRRLAGEPRRLGRTARRTGRNGRTRRRGAPHHLSARQFALELLFAGGVAHPGQ